MAQVNICEKYVVAGTAFNVLSEVSWQNIYFVSTIQLYSKFSNSHENLNYANEKWSKGPA